MDSGIIIALATSLATFLTVLITNLFNFWNKQIDSKQKIDEHKLSLRTVYITKKIEAGEGIIKAVQIRILASSAINQFYTNLRENNILHLNMAERAKALVEKLVSSIDDVSHFSAYYEMEHFSKIESDLFNILNQNISIINKSTTSPSQYLPNNLLDSEVSIALITTQKLNDLYNSKLRNIRSELAKYDIL